MTRTLLFFISLLVVIHCQTVFSETFSEQVPVIFNGEEMLVGGFVIDAVGNIYMTQGRNGVLKGSTDLGIWEQITDTYSYSTSLDADGALWIACYGQLIKYENDSIANFYNEALNDLPSISALPGNVVWGAGWSVLRYDIPMDSITYYDESDGLPSIGNWMIATPDGDVWMSHTVRYECHNCLFNGISHFDGAKWENFNIENGLLDKRVTSIVAISSSEVYIAGPGGIAKYNGEALEPFNTTYDVQCLAKGSDGSLWATGYRIGGWVPPYVHIKFEDNDIYEYEYEREYDSLFVTNMEIDTHGVIWESVSGKLFKHVVTDPVIVDTPPEEQPLTLSVAPNPFNPVTTLSFSLQEESDICLDIYDITGQHIDTIANRRFFAGNHSIQWNGSRYASGIYLCRLSDGDTSVTSRMCLVR